MCSLVAPVKWLAPLVFLIFMLSSLVWQLLLYCCFTAALLLLVVIPNVTWLKWLASRSFLFFSYSESPVSISYRHTGHEFVACGNMTQGFFFFKNQ
jgi:hypothetical protein